MSWGSFVFWSCLCDVLHLVPEVAGARQGKLCTYVIWLLLWASGQGLVENEKLSHTPVHSLLLLRGLTKLGADQTCLSLSACDPHTGHFLSASQGLSLSLSLNNYLTEIRALYLVTSVSAVPKQRGARLHRSPSFLLTAISVLVPQ